MNPQLRIAKELHKRTGISFGECVAAARAFGSDLEAATHFLLGYRPGIKSPTRVRSSIAVGSTDGSRGVLLELSTQTDLAATTEEFLHAARRAAGLALMSPSRFNQPTSTTTIDADPQEALRDVSETLGETCRLHRIFRVRSGANSVVACCSRPDLLISCLLECAGDPQCANTLNRAQELAASVAEKYANLVSRDTGYRSRLMSLLTLARPSRNTDLTNVYFDDRRLEHVFFDGSHLEHWSPELDIQSPDAPGPKEHVPDHSAIFLDIDSSLIMKCILYSPPHLDLATFDL